MKVFESNVKIPVKWGFACDGQTLRSSVVGGHQAEIYKGNLKIIRGVGTAYTEFVGTRRNGIKRATLILGRLLGGSL